MPKDRPEEKLAREIVAGALGARVTQYDDNTQPAMVDALIEYPDGVVGALEITGDHDGAFYQLWKELERVGHEMNVGQLQHGWVVVISHRAKFRRLEEALADLLRLLENAELSDLRECREPAHDEIEEIAQALGVEMAYVADHLAAGHVKLRAEGWSGISGSISLGKWSADVLNDNPDVPAKLAAHGGVSERHAFLWATIGSDYAIQFGLENRSDGIGLENEPPPELPFGVTHLWIAGSMSSQGAVAWSSAAGWWRTEWNRTDGNRDPA